MLSRILFQQSPLDFEYDSKTKTGMICARDALPSISTWIAQGNNSAR
jgi:hypothetical protein